MIEVTQHMFEVTQHMFAVGCWCLIFLTNLLLTIN